MSAAPVTEIPAARGHPASRGDYVAVSIADEGSGIAESDLERIFEPFFTTKGIGHGTGLGLSQVIGFAKQSGGEVTVESEIGLGTTFVLYLPQVAGVPEVASARIAETLIDGGGKRVLIVEDNAAVGSSAGQTLKELGYATVLAPDAATALAMLGERPDGFDVVFSCSSPIRSTATCPGSAPADSNSSGCEDDGRGNAGHERVDLGREIRRLRPGQISNVLRRSFGRKSPTP